MVQLANKSPKLVVSIVLVFLSVATFVAFFIIGGITFARESTKIKHYANTTCKVDSATTSVQRCKTRYSYYTCYEAVWTVFHGVYYNITAKIEDTKRYESLTSAIKRSYDYKVTIEAKDSIYSCWYDTRFPEIAQWNKPSITVPAVYLSIGGLAVILTGIFGFLAIKFYKQEVKRSNYDSISS